MFDPMQGPMHDRGDGIMGTSRAPYVQFHPGTFQDKAATVREGRPIFQTVDFVRIQHPGEKDFQDRPATDIDKSRYRDQWKAYQEGRDHVEAGTPLSVLFPTMPGMVENLKFHKVFTVERLANLTDTQAQEIGMGGMRFREEARQYIAVAANGREFHELRDANEKMSAALAAANQQISELRGVLSTLQRRMDDDDAVAPRRGPGRPPKNAAA